MTNPNNLSEDEYYFMKIIMSIDIKDYKEKMEFLNDKSIEIPLNLLNEYEFNGFKRKIYKKKKPILKR